MFDRIFRLFIIILPWSVLASVFLGTKLGIPGISYFKEVFLIALGGIIAYEYFKKKEWPKADVLDYLVIGYILVLILITLFNGLSLGHLIYGGRYDFEFLLALLIAKHGSQFLAAPVSKYIRLFLISASWTLIFGILIRFVFKETFLLHFGYSPNLSNWSFGGPPPIYHGIDGANVRRFQGIFDGPNPAAYFILIYIGLLVHYFRAKKEYHFLIGLWILVLLWLIFLTYSRSALIGLVLGIVATVLFSIRTIWKHHKKDSLIFLVVFALLSGMFYLKYEGTISKIITREGSSKGHFDRAVTGLKRFREHPMGQWLATSGPAYRYVTQAPPDEMIYDVDTKKIEDYYIPESWYIQQLVEWGIIGFVLFSAIMGYIAILLFSLSPAFFASFVAVLTMNLFLHSFESVYISLILFLFVGVFIGKKKKSALTDWNVKH